MLKKERLKILGCPVDNLTLNETIGVIGEMIRQDVPHQHVVINADKLLKFRKDGKLKQIISNCDIINGDGMAVVWASRILGSPLKERVAGIDLMARLVELAWQRGYKLYFLGAKEEIVRRVVSIYTNKYPGLQIVGFRNGYWNPREESKVINDIQQVNPDILFVAISSPKKEYFLGKYLTTIGVPFAMGVGGAFDVVVGLTKRAPMWMQRTGFEWLYRLILEPSRLWRRYLIGNAIFIYLVLSELVRKGKK